MVTAELAVALPALVLVSLMCLCGAQVVLAQLRCLDAATVAARLAARGDSTGPLAAAGAAPGSRLDVRTGGGLVTARVTADVHPLGLGGLLPPFVVSETAVMAAEPSPTATP